MPTPQKMTIPRMEKILPAPPVIAATSVSAGMPARRPKRTDVPTRVRNGGRRCLSDATVIATRATAKGMRVSISLSLGVLGYNTRQIFSFSRRASAIRLSAIWRYSGSISNPM